MRLPSPCSHTPGPSPAQVGLHTFLHQKAVTPIPNGGNGQSKFGFESVSYLQASLGFVICQNFIEILLHQRMKANTDGHGRARRFATPDQNLDSSRRVASPESIWFSRRSASSSRSCGEDSGATLRSSSPASLRRERCGSFRARSWISAAVFIEKKEKITGGFDQGFS